MGLCSVVQLQQDATKTELMQVHMQGDLEFGICRAWEF